MKLRQTYPVVLIIYMLIVGCTINANDINGVYVGIDYVNTKDTIIVSSEGAYERLVYDRKGKLALKMSGKWTLKGNLLTMQRFFLNLDQDVDLYPELLKDTVMTMEVLVERDGDKLKFCTGYLNDKNCYRKIVSRDF